MDTAVVVVESAVASCAAAVVSTPFEVIKVRLQVQGELMRKGQYTVEYRGIWSGLYRICQTEGIRGVQRGLLSSFAHQSILNGFRLGMFYPVRTEVARLTGHQGMYVDAAVGMLCGMGGAFLASPIFLVKTRLQTQRASGSSGGTSGGPAGSTSTRHYEGLYDGLRTVYQAAGVAGLMRGAGTSCMRTGVGSAVQLSGYEGIKRFTMRWSARDASDTGVHLFSSVMASFFGAMLMNPLDVIMTRRFNADGQQYQRNLLSTTKLIVTSEGLSGLGKGAFALWARLGPHTVVMFLVLEKLRAYRQVHFGLTASEKTQTEVTQRLADEASAEMQQ